MIQVRRLGHATFTTPQLERQVEYYHEIMGLAVVEKTRTRAILATKQGQEAIELLQGDESALTRISFQASPRDDPQSVHHIAFEVKDWPEINRACDYLARNNIQLVWGPGRHIIGHNIACYHVNSDGVRVECYTEMDQMKDEELGYFDPRPWH